MQETKETKAQISENQKQDDDLSSDERINEISLLIQSPENIRKIELFLRRNIIKFQGHSYEELEKELLSLTVERLLEKGRRKWPRHVSAITMIAQTARSILSDIRNSKDALASHRRYESNCADQDHDVWLETITNDDASKLYISCLSSKETLEEINKLFDDDKVALEVLYGKHECGYTPEEIQTLLELTPTEYNSKLTKIKRRLTKFQKG